MVNKKALVYLLAVVVVLFVSSASGASQSQKGTLEITGVPNHMVAGRYEPNEGIFFADVSQVSEAQIKIEFEEVKIFGQKLEWRTKDDYAIFNEGARLEKDDFKLVATVVEYFGEEKKLIAQQEVVVTTEEATVYADHLDYNEETDEALFTGNVRIIFEDGNLEGEKFLMLLEKNEVQFFGSFQGEFGTEDNK